MMVLLVGVSIVIGIVIFNTMSESTVIGLETQSGSSVNETIATVNEAGTSFDISSLRDVVCASVSNVLNASGNVVIPSANYTQTACSIAYSGPVDDTFGFNNSNWKVSYTFTFTNYTTAGQTGNDMIDGLGTGMSWITIIIVVFFASVVLKVLLSGANKNTTEAVAPY